MPSNARIRFGNDLIDLSQPASLKVIQKGGKFQLCIILGIVAQEVPPMHPGDKDKVRDCHLDEEIFITGRANIGLKKKGSNDDTSILSIAFDGDTGTKVPGTGAGLMPFDFDVDTLNFESTPKPEPLNN
jgi:hypothetical protein